MTEIEVFDDLVMGVLLPEQRSKEAIAASQYRFLPLYESDGETAIRISGRRERGKPAQFMEMAKALAGHKGNGLLKRELSELQRLGETSPLLWQDRARLLLLVNSYEQAKWVADILSADENVGM